MYVALEAVAGRKADARTRTGDRFITSELSRFGGIWCRVAGSG
jgi:hypothetical protein